MPDYRGQWRGANRRSDIQVTGDGGDFYRLSKALKEAGRKDLRRELNKSMRRAVKPLVPLIREAARERLPHRGGLSEVVAKSPIRGATRTGRDPGVKVVMPKRQPGYNFGEIRHPVFADKKNKTRKEWTWVDQQVDGDWFDGTIVDNSAKVRPLVEAGLEAVADKVIRDARGGR